MKRFNVLAVTIIPTFLILLYAHFGTSIANNFGYYILSEREKIIDLNVSIQSEKDNKKVFWWLADSLNMVSIINKSPKDLNIKLKMNIQKNPCGYIEKFQITKDKKVLIDSKRYNLEDDISVEFQIKIERFRTANIIVESKNNIRCGIDNGDRRKFIAKLSNLTWEVTNEKNNREQVEF